GALLMGSGGFIIEEVYKQGCNMLISSEFKHHEILFALDHNMVLVDIKHQSEAIFIKGMYYFLNEILPPEVQLKTMSDSYSINIY
ncbi:MAG: Nif3-like dinuclear metal center hexameric protein, partial [Bacilli bacterium]